MKTIRILLAFIGFALIGINAHAQKETKNDTVVIVGQIVKEQFEHNKPVEGVYDYFFESGTKKYFIKTYKGKFSKKELDTWVHYAARVKAVVVEQGNWDDNGEGQSRVGEYIVPLSIEAQSYTK